MRPGLAFAHHSPSLGSGRPWQLIYGPRRLETRAVLLCATPPCGEAEPVSRTRPRHAAAVAGATSINTGTGASYDAIYFASRGPFLEPFVLIPHLFDGLLFFVCASSTSPLPAMLGAVKSLIYASLLSAAASAQDLGVPLSWRVSAAHVLLTAWNAHHECAPLGVLKQPLRRGAHFHLRSCHRPDPPTAERSPRRVRRDRVLAVWQRLVSLRLNTSTPL